MDIKNLENHALLMAPEIGDKRTDVAEDWIHFVDESALSCEWLSFHGSV